MILSSYHTTNASRSDGRSTRVGVRGQHMIRHVSPQRLEECLAGGTKFVIMLVGFNFCSRRCHKCERSLSVPTS